VVKMRVKALHRWDLSRKEAEQLQQVLSKEVSSEDVLSEVRIIGGVDVAYKGDSGIAACVVLRFPDLDLIECATAEGPVGYPYISGLLSFREIPLLIPALEKLTIEPDIIIADGQGIAHPRRFGLASHLGVLLEKPVIGCAKSSLTGSYREPAVERGGYEYIYDHGRIVGAVLRTRAHVKPVFVSVGHGISLKSAIHYTIQSTLGLRLPEPVRYAHRAASGS